MREEISLISVVTRTEAPVKCVVSYFSHLDVDWLFRGRPGTSFNYSIRGRFSYFDRKVKFFFREESWGRATGKDLIPDFAFSLGAYGHLLNQVMASESE